MRDDGVCRVILDSSLGRLWSRVGAHIQEGRDVVEQRPWDCVNNDGVCGDWQVVVEEASD